MSLVVGQVDCVDQILVLALLHGLEVWVHDERTALDQDGVEVLVEQFLEDMLQTDADGGVAGDELRPQDVVDVVVEMCCYLFSLHRI